MLKREELKAIRTEFWTVFGRMMNPHHSSTGFKVRWTNYRTGVPDLYFRCHMEKNHAAISIDLQHNDPGMRALFWEQFEEYKTYFHSIMETEYVWEERTYLPDGKEISRISLTLPNVSLFNKATWPDAFEFLKTNLLRLDEFWGDVHLTFKEFAK